MKSHASIRLLSPEIVALIAAGEVIERPAYAVKELIDNAIDAQAHRIQIDLQHGGIDQIIVEDDGIGMHDRDLLESWKLHTTSKISSLDDLQAIRTQGFRGEALASIASVARLTIQSRQSTSVLGSEIIIEHQRMVEHRSIGMPAGTRVIVEHLFGELPARQKFLSSSTTELRHIISIIFSIAIAHPKIRFIVRHGKKIILNLSSAVDMLERLEGLYDERLTSNLIPIKFQESYITIDGFLGHPSIASSVPSVQAIILNNRPITDRMISTTIRDAMQELLPRDLHPVYVLCMTVPPELIDVNIHPRKETVAFVSKETVQTALQTAITEVLLKHDLTFSGSLRDATVQSMITATQAGKYLKAQIRKSQPHEPLSSFSQLHDTYLLTETDEGILLIDQHAAHERILYEKSLAEYLRVKKASKHPLHPTIRFALSIPQSLLIKEHLAVFEDAGFDLQIDEKKKPVLLIRSVPTLLSDRDPLPILTEMIADLEDGMVLRTVDSLTHLLLTYVACRSAVKAGDPLDSNEMLEIYTQLLQTPNRSTCPHGRPTMIEIPKKDLEKMFGRR